MLDRDNTTQVLLPDNLDKLKDITTHISGVLKRPVYADIPEKLFRACTVVMDENGLPVQDHKYVFSPEVVQRKVRAGAGCYILQKA